MKRYYVGIQKTLLFALVFWSPGLLADDCSDYDLNKGIEYQIVDGSDIPKILSTSSAVPFSVDVEDVQDAYIEAELSARAQIAKLLNELVSSDTRIEEEALKIAKINDEQRQASSERTKNILKRMTSSSEALLRGVVTLGDCHTPNREVRVTVGLKPETVAITTGLADGINSSFQEAETPNSQNSVTTSGTQSANASEDEATNTTLRKVGGSNNSEKIKNF